MAQDGWGLDVLVLLCWGHMQDATMIQSNNIPYSHAVNKDALISMQSWDIMSARQGFK